MISNGEFSILVAVDPWLVDADHTGVDGDLRVEALQELRELLARPENLDLQVLPFVDGDYWNLEGVSPDRANPPPWQPLAPYLDLFCCDDERSDAPVAGVADGLPKAPRRWLLEVQDAVQDDSSPNWRDPIFLVPGVRRDEWPSGDEIEIKGTQATRVIALLEDPRSSLLFATDLNPWYAERLRGRNNSKDREVNAVRDLPMPECIQGVRMGRWQAQLSAADDSALRKGERLAFVPRHEWAPDTVAKPAWRHPSCPLGELGRKVIPKGLKKGPRDRRGRIWAWDEVEHTHWDVQHEDNENLDYMNIRTDGIIKKGYGD